MFMKSVLYVSVDLMAVFVRKEKQILLTGPNEFMAACSTGKIIFCVLRSEESNC